MANYTEEQLEKRRAGWRAWYQKNKERLADRQREYELLPEVKARRNASARKRRTRPDVLKHQKTLNRRWKHRVKYGLADGQYEAMLAAQDGVCAICERPETSEVKGVVKSLAVDHDHTTGKVRGLLCERCNQALGRMQDQPDRLRRAAEYLEQHQETPKCS